MMSIAVSTVVQPSRIAATLTLSMCAGCVAIGVVIGMGGVGSLTLIMRAVIASICIAVAVLTAVWDYRKKQVVWLDVSGTGVIRIRQSEPETLSPSNNSHVIPRAHEVVELLPTSTIWNSCMILNLRAEDGYTKALIIFPDSMPTRSFRILSIACRWIAAHNLRAKI
jgi:toxin CptA